MNTKMLMIVSAVLMGLTGVGLIFLPDELLAFLHISGTRSMSVGVQILGTLYFSFAMLNWTAKAHLIGGIYSRPVSIGNFCHFFTGTLVLIKGAMAIPGATTLWICSGIYGLLAIGFGIAFFTHPGK